VHLVHFRSEPDLLMLLPSLSLNLLTANALKLKLYLSKSLIHNYCMITRPLAFQTASVLKCNNLRLLCTQTASCQLLVYRVFIVSQACCSSFCQVYGAIRLALSLLSCCFASTTIGSLLQAMAVLLSVERRTFLHNALQDDYWMLL